MSPMIFFLYSVAPAIIFLLYSRNFIIFLAPSTYLDYVEIINSS